MSRIGKLPIAIPTGVKVTVSTDNIVTVKGPKGELTQQVHPEISIEEREGQLFVTRSSDVPAIRSAHGLYRSLVNNMVVGVSQGYRKELELVGVGYRAEANGQILQLTLGYSHPIYFQMASEIKVETKSERNKNPMIFLESADKQLIGQICSKIRSFRKPEPYKGKGIRFVGEVIRRKAGKSAGAK